MARAKQAKDHETVSIYPFDAEQIDKICTLSTGLSLVGIMQG
jgi:hypothetical protein